MPALNRCIGKLYGLFWISVRFRSKVFSHSIVVLLLWFAFGLRIKNGITTKDNAKNNHFATVFVTVSDYD